MTSLNCIIIGAGQAGTQRPDGNHASAILAHPDTALVGLYDTDQDLCAREAERLGCQSFNAIDAALATDPDIVVVAVHPEHRAPYLEAIYRTPSVQAINCEKPMAYSYREAKAMVEACRASGKRLYINFQRRANPTYITLRDELRSGRRGRLQTANFYYTRGVWANSSHWMDLAVMLFGAPQWLVALESQIPSPYPDDPNAVITFGYADFEVRFIPLLSWEQGFYTGDIELIFDTEKVIVPNITHYQTGDVARWTVTDMRLTRAAGDIELFNPDDDFTFMHSQIVSDIQADRPEAFDPDDSAWTVHLLSLAAQSMKDRVVLDVTDSVIE